MGRTRSFNCLFWLVSAILVSACLDTADPPTQPISVAVFTPTAISAPIASPIPTPAAMPRPTHKLPPSPSPSPCAIPGHIQTGRYHSQIVGQINFRIYLPPCYGEDGRVYPTLYLLPGNIHTDAIWDELGLDEAAETAIFNQSIPPLLLVMSDGSWIANNSSGGPGSYESVILYDLIPFIESNYCAWPAATGRAIGGLSRGGYWALEIAFRHPDHFISVGGHSAALLDIAAGPALNPQQTGLHNDLGELRIYFDIGADDYLIHNIRRLHEDMETAAIPHTWVLNEGPHEAAYWAAHVGDYLAWYTVPWSIDRTQYPTCN